ncbi:MAG: hypothetical protein RL095_2732 [Verrucomicrobiota bacterium]|jgi:uncharacterized membrane protein YraQ (UPF0718 family)/copper chaperone CopZ
MLNFLDILWTTLAQLAPWFLLGCLLSGILAVVIDPALLRRHFGPGKRFGVVKAVLIGIPLPLCSCGVLPSAITLRRSGAGDPPAMAFLVTTPQTGLDSILVTAGMLGWPFALFRIFSALVIGLAAGWLCPAASGATAAPAPLPHRDKSWRAGWSFIWVELFGSLWKALLLGILLSALLTYFLPENALAETASWPLPLTLLAVLLLAVPLYLCSTASVPLAAALVAGGLPLPAALVLLIAGPATNLATLVAVRKEFGGRFVAVMLACIGLGSILLALIGAPWLGEMTADLGHGCGLCGAELSWWQHGAAAILAGFFAACAWREWGPCRSAAAPAASASRQKLKIGGMNCQSCVRKITAILAASGAAEISIRLSEGEAEFLLPPELTPDVAAKIAQAGFSCEIDGKS